VRVTVKNMAILGESKTVNMPGAILDFPAFTDKDRADMWFGSENGVDFIAASFIRSPAHVQAVREVLGRKGAHIKVIAKIENQEGIVNFDDILAAADGIMIPRADIGMEIPVEKVCMAQKMMIQKSNLAGMIVSFLTSLPRVSSFVSVFFCVCVCVCDCVEGIMRGRVNGRCSASFPSTCRSLLSGKPVIAATQILESMASNPRPTRTEVSDVTNVILDGADCLSLSAETAKGIFCTYAGWRVNIFECIACPATCVCVCVCVCVLRGVEVG
jgi:pyruvate kinase